MQECKACSKYSWIYRNVKLAANIPVYPDDKRCDAYRFVFLRLNNKIIILIIIIFQSFRRFAALIFNFDFILQICL